MTKQEKDKNTVRAIEKMSKKIAVVPDIILSQCWKKFYKFCARNN